MTLELMEKEPVRFSASTVRQKLRAGPPPPRSASDATQADPGSSERKSASGVQPAPAKTRPG